MVEKKENESDSQTAESEDNAEGEIDYKVQAETAIAERDQAVERTKQLENDAKSRNTTWMQQKERDRVLQRLEAGQDAQNELNRALVAAVVDGRPEGLADSVQQIQERGEAAQSEYAVQQTAQSMINNIFEQAEKAGKNAEKDSEYAEIREDFAAIRKNPNVTVADVYNVAQRASFISAGLMADARSSTAIKALEDRLTKSEKTNQETEQLEEEESHVTATPRGRAPEKPVKLADAYRLYNEGKMTAVELQEHKKGTK